jgi:CheY-like chemotaxis protein
MALGADDFYTKPAERAWLVDRLRTLSRRAKLSRILVIDDGEASRYALKEGLADVCGSILEAAEGREGLAQARAQSPQVIFLDLGLPDMPGEEVLHRLKEDPATREIPVILYTSRRLDLAERRRLGEAAAAILLKEGLAGDDASARLLQALAQAGLDVCP